MTAVHQFHPVLAFGDAMSDHVFALRARLREWGYDAEAYAVEAKPGVADVRSYRRLFREVKPDDVLIVHFSMGHEVIDQLGRLDRFRHQFVTGRLSRRRQQHYPFVAIEIRQSAMSSAYRAVREPRLGVSCSRDDIHGVTSILQGGPQRTSKFRVSLHQEDTRFSGHSFSR